MPPRTSVAKKAANNAVATPLRVVLFPSAETSFKLLLDGIDDHRRAGANWTVRTQHVVPQEPQAVAELLAWRPDGFIGPVPLPASLARCGVPWVSLRYKYAPLCVLMDEMAIGDAAAAHLAEMGCVSCFMLDCRDGEGQVPTWHAQRATGFRNGLRRRGLVSGTVSWLDAVRDPDRGWRQALLHSGSPRGIFTGNDWFGEALSEILQDAGLAIPDDVAVIGADDSPRAAALPIPLSSVQAPHRAVGRRGAELLSAAMARSRITDTAVMLPPPGVAVRRSTDPFGVADPEVSRVLTRIRASAHREFDVADAIAGSDLGRRSLEIRFRELRGRSIHEEIQHARVSRAMRLLKDPALSIGQVASECGFTDAPHFSLMFRRLTGLAPSHWRAANAPD